MSFDIEFNPVEEREVQTVKNSKSLVVYNDDFNTFSYVITCFILYCDHTAVQAEQCANIIHTTGKCSVKNGTMESLKAIREVLQEKGLIAKII